MMPSEKEMDSILCERHGKRIHGILKDAKIGIAGLGGLGSNIAMMLVRSGINDIVMADLDIVDLSNINRQNYCLEDIGSKKTDATESVLRKINPYMNIEKHHVRLDPSNIKNIFADCSIVCEAFDVPSEKAMLINTLLEQCPGTKVISGSGMAGYGRSDDITTKKISGSLYICGDGIDMEDAEGGLMSPRVNICAGHMANTVLALLIDGEMKNGR
jgi:sulfur carrier protein ThiS adenylyltransferase